MRVALPLTAGAAPVVMPPQPRRQLLIVQRSAAAARGLARYLRSHYQQVAFECSPQRVLAQMLRQPPAMLDVVCGQRFDDGDSGSTWIGRWRDALAPIPPRGVQTTCRVVLGRIVLATAEPLTCVPRGVDAVFNKPLDLTALLGFLGASPGAPA